MKIGDKFTKGGIIPAYGNEKSADQLIDELSEKNRRFRQLLNRVAAINENHKYFKSIAGIILEARKILSQ